MGNDKLYQEGVRGCVRMSKIYYNPNLTELARKLRNNMTTAEKSIWYSLKGKQLKSYDFHRQKPVGEFIYDFYSFDLKLVIEIDGFTHNEPEVIENDKAKDDFVKSIGFNILRFKDEEVLRDGNIVIRRIVDYIKKFESEIKDTPPAPSCSRG